ncbi:hypothetical protein DL93DRAFT_2090377, partial [Clavulina sp. PMI_390]
PSHWICAGIQVADTKRSLGACAQATESLNDMMPAKFRTSRARSLGISCINGSEDVYTTDSMLKERRCGN